jgi:hypothetical protein
MFSNILVLVNTLQMFHFRFSLCSDEKMILNILRKALKKTRKTYIQAYGQTEDRRRVRIGEYYVPIFIWIKRQCHFLEH